MSLSIVKRFPRMQFAALFRTAGWTDIGEHWKWSTTSEETCETKSNEKPGRNISRDSVSAARRVRLTWRSSAKSSNAPDSLLQPQWSTLPPTNEEGDQNA